MDISVTCIIVSRDSMMIHLQLQKEMESIMETMEAGDLDGLRNQLQENPALLSMRDGDGYTLFLHAVRLGQVEAVNLLVSLGASLELTDNDGVTSLIFGRTPLHEAINVGIAQALLDAGASPSIQDDFGNTPLHLAASRGNSEVVMLLAPLSDVNLVGIDFFCS